MTSSARFAVGLLAALLATLIATAPHAAPSAWKRIEHDALRGGGQVVYVHDVLGGEPGHPWLAVGYVVDSDGNRTPSAWTSNDGATWRRFAMESTGAPESRDGPFYVARIGHVVVAVGNRFDEVLRPAAWWSNTPGTWNALKSPADPLFAFDGTIDALGHGPDGFLAVGYRNSDRHTTVTVFRSSDGASWAIDSTFSTPANETLVPYDVVSTGARIVVVGGALTSAGARDGRIWVKANGTWESVDPAPLALSGPGFQELSAAAWSPTLGLIVGGTSAVQGTETPTLWYSATGDMWERLPTLEGGVAGVHKIATVPGGFIAAGSSDAGPRVWRSANGREWSSVPTLLSGTTAGKRISVSADGSKIVYVVTAQTGSQVFHRVGTGWERADRGPGFPSSKPHGARLLDIAASRGRVAAVGSDGDGMPLIMFSPGGDAWRRVEVNDKAARFLSVAADKGTFTIAGWRLVGGRAHLALWTSRTGTTWRRIGGGRGDPIGAFVDITPSRTGVLALAFEPGRRGLRTAVWAPRRGTWRPVADLGPGIARALCAGPNGAVAVATATEEIRSSIKVWARLPKGSWPREPEIVASRGGVARCAVGVGGTVLVGNDENFAAVSWSRSRPGERWTKSVLGSSAPRTEILDVASEGSGFIATGTAGGRGQADLAIWRSPDGARWSRLSEADPVSLEPGFQAGMALVKTGARVVVVGQHGAGNAGIWTGTP